MKSETKAKTKVAVFGGSFDPWTQAHEAIVMKVLEEGLADKVVISPTVVDYHREGKEKWLTDEQKIELIYMSKKLFEGPLGGKVLVNFRDLSMKQALSNTAVGRAKIAEHRYIDTLLDLMVEMQSEDIEWFTVIGSDSLKQFKTWSRWEDILSISKLIVVNGRDGELVSSDIPHNSIKIDDSLRATSGTAVRTKYKEMPNGIEQYKKQLQLLAPQKPDEILKRTQIFDLVQKFDSKGTIGFDPVGINSKDWVSVILLKGKEVLVEKQMRYGLMKELEELPCGMVENGETPRDAALRELREETGIAFKDESQLQYMGKFAANPAFMNNYMHYFVAQVTEDEIIQGKQELDAHEKLIWYWKDSASFIGDFMTSEGSAIMAAGLWLLGKRTFDTLISTRD